MIISASRRTDIPALYSEWFMNRLAEGHFLIPNPRNPNRLSRIDVSPENVDCIAFWTKNPIPMLDKLGQMDAMGYPSYIQFTLTPYEKAVEPGLPAKSELLQAFVDLSKQIGAVRSVWRYDPIIIDARHSVEWHIGQFAQMCKRLHTYTQRCVISFVDPYKSLGNSFAALTRAEMTGIASAFSAISAKYGIVIYTCAEEIDLSHYGIQHGACIDQRLIGQIINRCISAKSDANQRTACCCIESVDIGAYDTCPHGCSYCYATSGMKTVMRRVAAHDPHAPMLTGYPNGEEVITNRTTPSQKTDQLRLF